jgi:hypothetical protein
MGVPLPRRRSLCLFFVYKGLAHNLNLTAHKSSQVSRPHVNLRRLTVRNCANLHQYKLNQPYR